MSNKKVLHWYNDPVGKAMKKAIYSSIEIHGSVLDNDSKVNSVLKRVYGVVKQLENGTFNDARKKVCKKRKNILTCSE